MSSIRHPTFYRNQKKKYDTRKVRKGKGPSKRKAKRQETFRNGQCQKKKLAHVRSSYNSAICLIMLPKGSYLHSADATTTPLGSFRRGHWMPKTMSSGALMPCHCIFVSNIVIRTHLEMKLVMSATRYYYNFPVDT